MKKTILILGLLIFGVGFGQSQGEIPQDVNTVVVQKIQQEHQTTRQFTQNEIKRQVDFSIAEITKRGDFYTNEFERLGRNLAWRFGLTFAGIYLFFSSFSYWVKARTERRKYQVLKESLIKDVKAQVQPEPTIIQPPQPVQKPSFMDRFRQHHQPNIGAGTMQPVKTERPKTFKRKDVDRVLARMERYLDSQERGV